MKYIELKDLRPGQELILAWKDSYLNQYYPFKVKVKKDKKIVFEDLMEPDEIISYVEFHHTIKGFDINNNIVVEMGVFDNLKECQKWCDFENKINSENYKDDIDWDAYLL